MSLSLPPDAFAEALFTLPDRAVYGVDRDGLCIFANPHCLDLLGAGSEDDVIGRPMHALIHHTDGEGRPTDPSSCPIHSPDDDGPVIARRDRLWRFDGTSFPVECWSLPLNRDGKRVGRIVAFVRLADRLTGDDAVSNETHLRMAAEANAERAAALAEVARFPEMNPGPVVRTNAAGDVLLANTAARQVFGDGLIGSAWRALCPGIDDVAWRGILTSVEPVAVEAHIRESDYVFSHRCDPATELVFIFGSDVTRQKHAEHALRQSEKMATLGTLAAGVAHELNNPAAAASRAAEQLRTAFARLEQAHLDLEGLGLDADVRDRLRDLDRRAHERASARTPLSALERSDREAAVEEWLDDHLTDASDMASALVTLGLDSSELDSLAAALEARALPPVLTWVATVVPVHVLLYEIGQGSARISEIVRALKSYSFLGQAPVQWLDVHDGLDDTLVILRNKLKAGIEVHREYCADMPPVQAYGSELNQVWTNLIDNAADAMQGKGHLTIRTRREPPWAIVEVEDDGPGIPEELQPRIFDPFFTTKAPGHGTGLGLSTSYSVVTKKHQGILAVESRPGFTRFTVRLPLGSPTGSAEPPAS